MKRAICLILVVLTIVTLILCGCEMPEEVSRNAVDARYTPAYDSVETDVHYEFNPLGKETFKLMPDVHTVHHPEMYEVQYEIEYTDGSLKTVWEEVNFSKYKAVCGEIGKPQEEGK